MHAIRPSVSLEVPVAGIANQSLNLQATARETTFNKQI